jgi:hypothetical protein
MINKYRYIQYVEDGTSEYQCLSCYGLMNIYDNPEWSNWRFCPLCGVEWDGKLECRSKHVAPWEYRLQEARRDDIIRSIEDRVTREKTRGWVIEERTVFWDKDGDNTTFYFSSKEHTGASDWHISYIEDIRPYSAYTVCEHLKALRKREKRDNPDDGLNRWFGSYNEYRASIQNYPQNRNYWSVNKIWH